MARSPDSSERPEDFSEFQGPANWFRCRYPNSVRLAQKESVIEIRPLTGGTPVAWSMALYAAWVDPESSAETSPSFSVSATSIPEGTVAAGCELRIESVDRLRGDLRTRQPQLLAEELEDRVHALQLKTLTPAEAEGL